jgi:uncharacterized membrane protein YkvA (DUF1232 family)
MTERSPSATPLPSPRTGDNRPRHRAGLLSVLRHPGALWRFLSDREAPIWPRLVAVLTLAYVVLPIDAIPDVFPIVGWLDDLGVVTMALGFIASRAARYADAHPGALPESRT